MVFWASHPQCWKKVVCFCCSFCDKRKIWNDDLFPNSTRKVNVVTGTDFRFRWKEKMIQCFHHVKWLRFHEPINSKDRGVFSKAAKLLSNVSLLHIGVSISFCEVLHEQLEARGWFHTVLHGRVGFTILAEASLWQCVLYAGIPLQRVKCQRWSQYNVMWFSRAPYWRS